MKYYKLLNQDLTSYNQTKWELNVPITIQKEGNNMCSNQVLHCYNHPMIVVILNPIHANIENPKLFEIEVDEIVNSDGLKFASKSQTLLKEISLPEISLEQKVEFAIRVAKLVCNDKEWNLWADKWLDNSDCSIESAKAAANAAAYAAANAYAYAAAANAAAAAAAAAANAAAAAAAAAAADAKDKIEFNQKMIDIIESIVKVKE